MSPRRGSLQPDDRSDQEADRRAGLFYLRFVWGSLLRHPIVALGVFAAAMGSAALFIRSLPHTYHVETKLLARRQQSLPVVARPGLGEEAPTAGAFEAIHRRDNLASIIKAAGIWTDANEQPKSALRTGQGVTAEERLDRLIKRLDARLGVVASDSTLTVAIDWPDPERARRIVQAAAENFLEGRRAAEISPIEEAISILEGRATVLQANLDAIHADVLRARRSAGRASARRTQSSRESTSNVQQLEAEIRGKRRAIAELEDSRRRKLAELRGQLAQDHARYGEGFPALTDLQRAIDAISEPVPQVAVLREEQKALEAQYARQFGGTFEESPTATGMEPSRRDSSGDGSDAGEARLKRATLEYQSLLERINGARIELETARAAFKYRYIVLWPAQTPTRPDRPKVVKLALAGAAAALVLALLAALARDLVPCKLVDREQVERALDLEILGEVRAG